MRFDSLAELLSMSGHGPYVWSAYAIATLVLAANVVWPLMAARRNIAALREAVQENEEVTE